MNISKLKNNGIKLILTIFILLPINSSLSWSGTQCLTQLFELDSIHWKTEWGVSNRSDWGWQNLEIMTDPNGQFSRIIRVYYPAGSASPSVSRKTGAPLGGVQFYANLGLTPTDELRLSYFVRFSDNFDFVKGGKLPGLFGGIVHSGGNIPDGTNGFSTRYMWRKYGQGEVYAYLPGSSEYGTSMGRGSWNFKPGKWYYLEQRVVLNQPGKSNGSIQVWVDNRLVLEQTQLQFRTTDRLKIEGLFFSTFFGGGDPSWATPQDVFIDFAQFKISDR